MEVIKISGVNSNLLLLATGIVFLVFLVVAAIYVYTAVVLMVIAKKTKTEYPWLAWIPVANFYLMTKIAGMPWWTMLLLLLGFIPILGGLVIMAVTTVWWWKIAEARGKPGWYALLMLIPLVGFVIMGVIAWSDKKQSKSKAKR